MKKRMDVSNLSVNQLVKIFVDYVLSSSLDLLKHTYANVVYEEEDTNKSIGKFRLIHIFDLNDEDSEYLTFTVCFFDDENGTKKLAIHNIEKGQIILECTFDITANSWSSDKQYPGILQSSITMMAKKLKSILE